MLKVQAIIKPFKLDVVITALQEAKLEDVYFYEVKGYGRQKGYLDEMPTGNIAIKFLPKICVEFFIEKDKFENIMSLLLDKIRTGTIGDGKFFVQSIENVVLY